MKDTFTTFEPPGEIVSVTDSGAQVMIGAAGEEEGVNKTKAAALTQTSRKREKGIQKRFCVKKDIIFFIRAKTLTPDLI